MVSPYLVAVFVTIVPAMGALWWFLKRYEGYFEDARVFFALVVGFFTGLFATFLEFNVFRFWEPIYGTAASFVLTVVGYAFFETGAKVVVLGLKRFRQRKDTPYYGTALGLGFGAMAALQFVAVNLAVATQEGNAYRLLPAATMIAVPLGAVFVHGAAGAYVGQGSASGNLAKGWIVGALLQMPVLGAYWLFLYGGSIGQGNAVLVFPAVLSLAYGLFLLGIAQKRVLDPIVPPEIKAQVRREKRRARRAADGAAVAPVAADGSADEEE